MKIKISPAVSVSPKVEIVRAAIIAVRASTKGYRNGICVLQNSHRPLRIIQEATGMLCHHLSLLLQLGHIEFAGNKMLSRFFSSSDLNGSPLA